MAISKTYDDDGTYGARDPYATDNDRIARSTKDSGGSYGDTGDVGDYSNYSPEQVKKYLTTKYPSGGTDPSNLEGAFSQSPNQGADGGYQETAYDADNLRIMNQGTHQASDYSGSGSGGAYETSISPKASATMNDSPSYDYEQSSRAKRSSASGDQGNEVSALARTGVGGDQVSTLASAGRKKVI